MKTKSYRQLIQTFTKEPSGTCFQSFSQILNEIEELANSHIKFSNSIKEQRESLKNQIKENEKITKATFDEIRKLSNDLQKAVNKMEQSRESQERAKKDMQNAHNAWEKLEKDPKARKDAVEKHKVEADKKAAGALACVDAYNAIIGINRITLVETNAQKNKFFYEQLPKILNDFQVFDEKNRVEFTKVTFLKYNEAIGARREPLLKSFESLQTIFNLISPQFDSDCFIKLVKTGNDGIPEDYVFDEKVTSPLRRRTSLSSPVSSSLEKLCTDEAVREDENIISQPMKQGKRKAADRHKQIVKELPLLIQKLNGYDNLIAVQERESNVKSQQVLHDQKRNVQGMIDLLTQRKSRLEAYLGMACEQSPSSGAYESKETVEKHTQSQELPLARARAVFDFTATPATDEMSFEVGDTFAIHVKLEDGWWQVTSHKTEMSGLVPGNYLQEY